MFQLLNKEVSDPLRVLQINDKRNKHKHPTVVGVCKPLVEPVGLQSASLGFELSRPVSSAFLASLILLEAPGLNVNISAQLR